MPKRRIHLVKSQEHPQEAAGFRPDQAVVRDGIYGVTHADGRSQEVTLLVGESFPRCERCDAALSFRFLRAVQATAGDFRIRLYTLPHPEADHGQPKAVAL